MPRSHLPHLELNPNRHGRMRYYFRKARHEPRVRLPDTYGSPEFLQAYHAAALDPPHQVVKGNGGSKRKPPPPNAATIRAIYKLALRTPRSWKELRYLALTLYGRKCQCCGTGEKSGKKLHVDHIKPRSKFPELQWDLSNLQVLCEDCNMGKGVWDETDWRELAVAPAHG
jgi:5-methylcytosine-specific restriction endonuclease McrA